VPPSKKKIGNIGEDVAVQFLVKNGYEILIRNYYYNHGEIDVVAKEGDVLTFIEVKTRRSKKFGAPEEAVTPKKQELIRRTAEGYVAEKGIADIECRFDVVAVEMIGGTASCSLLRNCF
jgi:putative endonuclease